jgi:hypothetical protein
MKKPTLEDVASAWANWIAADIMESIREQALVVDEERIEAIIIERLVRVALPHKSDSHG